MIRGRKIRRQIAYERKNRPCFEKFQRRRDRVEPLAHLFTEAVITPGTRGGEELDVGPAQEALMVWTPPEGTRRRTSAGSAKSQQLAGPRGQSSHRQRKQHAGDVRRAHR